MDVTEYTITISCALANRCFSEGANSVELQSLLFWLVATGIEAEVVMRRKAILRKYGDIAAIIEANKKIGGDLVVEVVAGMYVWKRKASVGAPCFVVTLKTNPPRKRTGSVRQVGGAAAVTSRTMQTEKAVTLVQDQPEGGCGLKNRRWISVKYIIGEVLIFLVGGFVRLLAIGQWEKLLPLFVDDLG